MVGSSRYFPGFNPGRKSLPMALTGCAMVPRCGRPWVRAAREGLAREGLAREGLARESVARESVAKEGVAREGVVPVEGPVRRLRNDKPSAAR